MSPLDAPIYAALHIVGSALAVLLRAGHAQLLPPVLLILVALPCVLMQQRLLRAGGVACDALAPAGIVLFAIAYTLSTLYQQASLPAQLAVASHVSASARTLSILGDCATYVTFAITLRGLARLGRGYARWTSTQHAPTATATVAPTNVLP